ncbi:MAG TPA: oligosaccharide flippase family protein [Bacillota bacterium]|nr:oligosaccharide flippase family protein [Bacillota bacterium]
MDGSVFFKQLALRTSAIFLVKLLGFLARIPLFRLLGSEGIGLYQMAYSVYGLILTLLIGGFPTALAISTSKNSSQGWRLFQRTSVILFILCSIVVWILLRLSVDIAVMFGDPELDFAIRCLAPAVLIVPILSLFRGYLQGLEWFGAIALSEIVEQIVRTGIMVFLAWFWIDHGMSIAVGGATFGAFVGSLAALFFLSFFFSWRGNQEGPLQSFIKKDFMTLDPNMVLYLSTSLAIASTRLLIPVSDFLDALIVPHRLQDAGMTTSAATSLYGEISGMAITIVYIPTIITAALTHTMTSKMTLDWQEKKVLRFTTRARGALAVGWLWGIGSGMFLYFFAKEVSLLLFGTENIAKAIQLLSIAPLIGGMRDISTSILWIIGKRRAPLIGLILGIVLSIIFNYYLIAMPGMSYIGIVLGLLSIDFFSSVCNLLILHKSNLKIPMPSFILEGVGFVLILYVSFTVIQWLIHSSSFSPLIKSILQMTIFYGIIGLSLFIRFFKFNQLTNFRR